MYLQFRSLYGNIFRYFGQFSPSTTNYSTNTRAFRRTIVVAKTTLIVITCKKKKKRIVLNRLLFLPNKKRSHENSIFRFYGQFDRLSDKLQEQLRY